MIRDDIQPLTAFQAPPEGLDEAVARVSNFGAETFYPLIGMVFDSVAQFRMAMFECRWNTTFDVVMEAGRVVLHKATAVGADGTTWKFFLLEIGPHHMRVEVCKLIKQGDGVNKDFAELIHKTLDG